MIQLTDFQKEVVQFAIRPFYSIKNKIGLFKNFGNYVRVEKFST